LLAGDSVLETKGALLSYGCQASSIKIEIIELGNEAVPGAKPVNVALSIEIPAVIKWHHSFVNRGVTIARGVEDAPWGPLSFGVDDPDGFRIRYDQDIRSKQSHKLVRSGPAHAG